MRASFTNIESLEPRRLLSAVYPTVYEQYMVELYNAARADPAAAATKYGVALNEGPPALAISSDAKQPLAINPLLTDSARSFAQWMIDHNLFGHYVDGSNPQERMIAAGYSFTGPAYGNAENAGLISSSFLGDTGLAVDSDFRDFYTDGSVDGRYHRITMMNPTLKEIGSGLARGNYSGLDTLISVQDFAYSGTTSFLTGVAYTDSNHNNFYTPGEQMSGATITAIRNSDSAQFTTTTWTSGGYTLALPAGTYTIWGGGGTLGGWVRYDSVTIADQNVKRDFRPDLVNSDSGPGSPPPQDDSFGHLSAGKLTLDSTSGNDLFNLSVANGMLSITRNSETISFSASSVTSISLSAGDGNDTIVFGSGINIPSSIWGGNGDDSIIAGDGADILKGDAGNDTINGGGGNDRIYGGDNNDSLLGGNGADRVWGNLGDDRILGGNQNDNLYGDEGNDSVWGQDGNDLLDGRAGADYLSGGRNIDTADYSARAAGLYVELAGNASQATGRSGETSENDNVLADVENINGGSGNDRLIGSASANVIYGNAGNDTIYGMAAADSLFGGDGKDRFFVVDSIKDRIDGGTGRDTLSGDVIDLLFNIETH